MVLSPILRVEDHVLVQAVRQRETERERQRDRERETEIPRFLCLFILSMPSVDSKMPTHTEEGNLLSYSTDLNAHSSGNILIGTSRNDV